MQELGLKHEQAVECSVEMGRQPHVVIVPFPAQGHVRPLVKLAYKIADHGIKVLFVNTEPVHEKLFGATSEKVEEHGGVVFTAIPSGSKAADEHKSDMVHIMQRAMPGCLIELIEKTNASNKDAQITCVIADATMGWILGAAEKLGIEPVAFSAASVGSLAFSCHIPKLIEAGTIDRNGKITRSDEEISLSADFPPWKGTDLLWTFFGREEAEKVFFEVILTVQQTADRVKWLICNSFYELEPAACDRIPLTLPIGPLIERDTPRTSAAAGSLQPEDTSCLKWLDKQPPGSVIYVSFGSIAVVNQHQFNELALGLESSGQPFLWVVRSDLASGASPDYPEGFLERVADQGKLVDWAPQERVLAHPSVACFLTHCGWNSTMECLSKGVPFLCWPSFSDQFHNRSYICDVWRVGLNLNPDENGVRSSDEIKTKIQLLLSDDKFKASAQKFKKLAQESICQGGSSDKNFEKFIKFLKD